MDAFHHQLEHWVEALPRFLGVTIGEQPHRAFEVSEEHGDLLALAFQGGLGVDNPLGQVLRRVGLRCAEALRCLRDLRNGRISALGAELGGCGEVSPAIGARPSQGRRALLAELRPGAVSSPAVN